MLRRLFEPLAYEVTALKHPLDTKFSEWGESRYFTVSLKATVRLNDLLTHLYVLIPVLDDDKHYWVGDAEVEKLLRHGEGWLRAHPERELITNRYLKHQKRLAREALTLPTEQHCRYQWMQPQQAARHPDDKKDAPPPGGNDAAAG